MIKFFESNQAKPLGIALYAIIQLRSVRGRESYQTETKKSCKFEIYYCSSN